MANKSNLRYSLTDHGIGLPKGIMCVTVAYRGTSNGRKSYKIEGLTNPENRYWDKTTRRFLKGTTTARLNNPVLNKVCVLCDSLLEDERITTPAEFVEALKLGGVRKEETFGGFLRSLIDSMRNGTDNKLPSRNYAVYISLLHKLEREKTIINLPLYEIANKHFIRFSDYLLSNRKEKYGRSMYIQSMKRFKQVHTKAYELELNDNILRFPYTKYAPMRNVSEKSPALTKEQYENFCKLDVKTIPQHGVKANFYRELYKDFCIFLYEVKSRPVDVLRSKLSDVECRNGKMYLHYIPEKKKNFANSRNKFVYSPLSQTAFDIIKKYKGKSKKGYIFPFTMNDYDWNMQDAKSWNKWNIRKTRALELINYWLKKARVALNIDFNVTLYTFRHSALTHACMAEGANWGQIALESGTSIDMLEKHYVSNV